MRRLSISSSFDHSPFAREEVGRHGLEDGHDVIALTKLRVLVMDFILVQKHSGQFGRKCRRSDWARDSEIDLYTVAICGS
jgi:hypothetical protein